MPINDELGRRMKDFYETIPKTKLMRRTPVAIRIDGKAFHTFTRGMKRPFDNILIETMQQTMKYLCENIEQFKPSVEISDGSCSIQRRFSTSLPFLSQLRIYIHAATKATTITIKLLIVSVILSLFY